MDSKLLTHAGWNTIVRKFNVKDNGLLRALADYQKLDDDDHAERLKAIAKVSQLAERLAKVKEVAANEDVVDYLDDAGKAADLEQQQIAKAKVTADQAEAIAKKEEALEDKYEIKLWAMLQKIRSTRGLAYECIVCLSQPLGVNVAPRITQQHKDQLTKLHDGCKRFLSGSCSFENGKYAFTFEHPISGMARKLQDSIKTALGKTLPIMVGAETSD